MAGGLEYYLVAQKACGSDVLWADETDKTEGAMSALNMVADLADKKEKTEDEMLALKMAVDLVD